MNIVPTDKYDLVACDNLESASDDEAIAHLDELMEWIKDMNWPVAGAVLGRLSSLGQPLVNPIIKILKGNDELWKYWVMFSLLPRLDHKLIKSVAPILLKISETPTAAEVEEDLNIIASALLIKMTTIKFISDNCILDIVQIPFSLESNYDQHSYEKKYDLVADYKATSIYGLTSNIGNNNCIIFAGGGASGLSKHSVIIKESKCWIGIGDQLVCLSLPSLDMLWHKMIDEATCFGVFKSPDGKGIIIHGEIEISKISFSGEVIWTTSGKDIFTEGFIIYKDYVEAVDFNNEIYRINISNGENTILEV